MEQENPSIKAVIEKKPKTMEDLNLEDLSLEDLGSLNIEQHIEEDAIEKKKIATAEIMKEGSEELMESIEILTQGVGAIEKTDAVKNELQLKILSLKIKNICDRFLSKVGDMDDGELLTKTIVPGLITGFAIAGINMAGMDALADITAYLPDSIQHLLQDPKTAGNVAWSLIENGDGISSPSIENYMDQVRLFQEKLNTSNHWQRDMSRMSSGLINMLGGAGMGTIGYGIGRIIKMLNKNKQS